MEELNKTQIVLLTLLVSFVTSIATGIVTVTLLEQAPPAVTQTINRVVEKTVERVVPGETRVVERIKEVETIKTEDDLIIGAVSRNTPSLVLITLKQQTEAGETLIHAQTGFFVKSDGSIATAASALEIGKTYDVSWNNDKRTAEVITTDKENNLAILKLLSAKDSTKKDTINPIGLSTQSSTLGQTVLALGATEGENPTVSLGIISGVRQESASTTPRLQTTVDVTRSNQGGPLLNLRGEVVGVLIGGEKEVGQGFAVPASILSKLLTKIESVKEETGVPKVSTASAASGLNIDSR